jgi:hypothetical protein
MGTCFSATCIESGASAPSSPTARVVSISGALKHHNVPISVLKVLETEISGSSSKSEKYFICNSDQLYYDDYIPALNQNDELQENQIYFVLPISKLKNKLSASDMAALAVKASVALQNASKKDSNRRKKARISPVLLVNQPNTVSFYSDNYYEAEKTIGANLKSNQQKPGPAMSRSSSVKRLHRYTSRRAKLAVRSFRMRLSTIYEGTVQA